ncbi:MAG: hypothetical protein Q4B86_00595 [Eubacteriales bacterium]|nr:hypothetical protein [Eubacteriales bacterium]
MSKEKNKYSDKGTYKRDTIAMISVLVILFLAPIGITLYEGSKNTAEESAIQTNIDEEVLEDVGLLTPSNATPSEIDETVAE